MDLSPFYADQGFFFQRCPAFFAYRDFMDNDFVGILHHLQSMSRMPVLPSYGSFSFFPLALGFYESIHRRGSAAVSTVLVETGFQFCYSRFKLGYSGIHLFD
jgi:hypothetical protein